LVDGAKAGWALLAEKRRTIGEKFEMTVIDAALRPIADRLHGANATDGDIQLLRSRLSNDLVPDWLVNLLKSYRLAGVCFSLSASDDQSGIGAEVIWLTVRQIISEAFESEPGKSVVSLKFLPIGACAIGSGDPYFLDVREASNDPLLVRVPHDCAAASPYPLERVEVVASRLSVFFGNASV
jgi:hypothetical protein